jgi:hypothetical protein
MQTILTDLSGLTVQHEMKDHNLTPIKYAPIAHRPTWTAPPSADPPTPKAKTTKTRTMPIMMLRARHPMAVATGASRPHTES